MRAALDAWWSNEVLRTWEFAENSSEPIRQLSHPLGLLLRKCPDAGPLICRDLDPHVRKLPVAEDIFRTAEVGLVGVGVALVPQLDQCVMEPPLLIAGWCPFVLIESTDSVSSEGVGRN